MPDPKINYALCKAPYADHAMRYEQLKGQPLELTDMRMLNGREGYVFAPFCVSEDTPIILIQPDKVERIGLGKTEPIVKRYNIVSEKKEKEAYYDTFSRFYQGLEEKRFNKLVLGRTSHIELAEEVDAEALFWKACYLYPRMYVALVVTEKSGTWLMATPEVLLSGNGGVFRTMSLAGTMKLGIQQEAFDNPVGIGEKPDMAWSDKNVEEQEIVSTYICECLNTLSNEVEQSNPYTQRAGSLVHLRSDFTFKMKEEKGVGDAINALFPTPAVCGMPKEEAWHFIVTHEHESRRYYSGFTGPICSADDFQLYVTLRCMQIDRQRLCLYAGGGLLPDSDVEQEWNETEAKMETMRNLIYV